MCGHYTCYSAYSESLEWGQKASGKEFLPYFLILKLYSRHTFRLDSESNSESRLEICGFRGVLIR